MENKQKDIFLTAHYLAKSVLILFSNRGLLWFINTS